MGRKFRRMVPSLVGFLMGTAQAGETILLRMSDALEAARSHSPEIQASRAEYAQHRAKIGESLSALLPHVSLATSYRDFTYDRGSMGLDFPGLSGQGGSRITGPLKVWDYRVNASLDLFDLPAWLRWDSARERAEMDGMRNRADTERILLSVARDYLALALSEGKSRNARLHLRYADSLRILVDRQKRAGILTNLDVTRAELNASRARRDLAGAAAGSEQARIRLLREMGWPLDTAFILGDSLGLPPLPPGKGYAGPIDSTGSGRAEIGFAEQALKRGRHNLASIRLEALPSLTATADYGYTGPGGSPLERTRAVALLLVWRGWDGLDRWSRASGSRAEIRQLEARLRGARAEVESEILSARASLTAAREMVAASQEEEILAGRELDQAEERFRSGALGSLDMIDAQDRLVRAGDARLDAIFTYNLSRLALLHALGNASAF